MNTRRTAVSAQHSGVRQCSPVITASHQRVPSDRARAATSEAGYRHRLLVKTGRTAVSAQHSGVRQCSPVITAARQRVSSDRARAATSEVEPSRRQGHPPAAADKQPLRPDTLTPLQSLSGSVGSPMLPTRVFTRPCWLARLTLASRSLRLNRFITIIVISTFFGQGVPFCCNASAVQRKKTVAFYF